VLYDRRWHISANEGPLGVALEVVPIIFNGGVSRQTHIGTIISVTR